MRARAGFTLAELMIGVVLVGAAFSTAGALMSFVVRSDYAALSSASLGDEAALIDHALLTSVQDASWIQHPDEGSSSSRLLVWTNVDPATQAPITAGPQEYSLFCVEPEGGLWLYSGRGFPAPAVACGRAAPRGADATRLSGGPTSSRAQLTCLRRAPNLVQVSYSLSAPATAAHPAMSLDRETSFGVQEASQ